MNNGLSVSSNLTKSNQGYSTRLEHAQHALLNMQTPRLAVKFASFADSVVSMIVQNTVGDLPWLLLNTERFITMTLYDRAAETGVAQGYIGPKLLCDLGVFPTITLVSGATLERPKQMVLQVTNYDDEDPASRQSFGIVQALVGGVPNVILTGARAAEGRMLIKHQLVGQEALKAAYTFTQQFIKTAFKKWDEGKSVQDHITYISSNVIGRCVFGIPYVPMRYAKLLQEAGRMVVNPRPRATDVQRLASLLRAMSDELLSHREAGTLNGFPVAYLNLTTQVTALASEINEMGDELLVHNKTTSSDNLIVDAVRESIVKKLKELNAGADVIVEGNLSFLIVSGIIQVSQNPEVKARLRGELRDFDWNQENAYDVLSRLDYLECVYTESLRHPSPAGMLDRQVSQPYTIEGQDRNGNKSSYSIAGKSLLTPLLGNSHMMVCVSSIHHDPAYWERPNEFDPARFDGEAGKKRKDRVMPFSVGKRACPAGSADGSGFAASVAKLVIAWFTVHYDLTLHTELKDVPADSFFRGWDDLFASITPFAHLSEP